jgi:hypothetical protein
VLRKIAAFAACTVVLALGSLLKRGWIDLSVVDPSGDPTRSGAVYGWGWPLEFVADAPYPFQDGKLGTGDRFLVRPFLFDMMVYGILVGAVVLAPVLHRRTRD